MAVVLERRAYEDRREFEIFYRYGCERRNNTGNRRLDTVEKLQPYLTVSASQVYARDSDGTRAIVKEIADAFGVHADTLEMLEYGDLADSTEICLSCKDRARVNAELRSELAESKKTLDLYKSQIGELLLFLSTARRNMQ